MGLNVVNLATMLLANSAGMGNNVGRSISRMLQETAPAGWSEGYGTWFAPGTVIPSYLNNATAPPPYAQTQKDVLVVEECKTATFDCECLILGKKCSKSKNLSSAETCANNNMQYKPADELLWTVIVGAIVGCTMAFGIGANDSANSWATSIGSGAIRSAYGLFIGGLAEFCGAVLLGYSVSGTIRKGIAPLDDPDCWACGYCNTKMAWYAAAMCATLVGAVSLTFLATWTAMPISTTHAVIGGACGATIAATSWGCLNWSFQGGGLFAIMVSWVSSPILSGIICATSYLAIVYCALNRKNPRKHSLIAVVACTFLTTFIMVFMVMLKSYYTKKLAKWIMVLAGLGGGALIAGLTALILIPILRKRWPSDRLTTMEDEDIELSKSIKQPKGDSSIDDGEEADDFAVHAAAPSLGEKYVQAVRAASQHSTPAGIGGSMKGSVKHHFETMGVKGSFAQSIKEAFDINATPEEVLNYDFIPEEIQEAKKEDMDQYTPHQKDAVWAFRYLLVYQAALESFAHGANDTANATGAFMAVYNVYVNGIYDCIQDTNVQWIMAVAGAFVALGVNLFGYKVIRTIGTNMTDMNFIRGWCVEFATTTAVVIATILGMPVSTTHCVVGAVVFVGLVAHGRKGVSWGLVGKIGLSWIVTLPISGLVAYAFSWLFSLGVRN